MSMHVAEQLELLEQEPPDPIQLLIKQDPLVNLINEAKEPLDQLNAISKEEAISAFIGVNDLKISANRVNALCALEKAVHTLKMELMRHLGGLIQDAKAEGLIFKPKQRKAK